MRQITHHFGLSPHPGNWCGGNALEASGECEIDEHVIDAYIEAPPGRTTYILRVIYDINDETLVEQLEMVVT